MQTVNSDWKITSIYIKVIQRLKTMSTGHQNKQKIVIVTYYICNIHFSIIL